VLYCNYTSNYWPIFLCLNSTVGLARHVCFWSRCLQCNSNAYYLSAVYCAHEVASFSNSFPRCMECQRGLAMRKVSVCPSVCLFVCQTRDLWQNGRKICPYFIPHERSFSLVFWEKKGWWRATPSTWILGQPVPVGAKSPIMNRYSLVAPQPQHLSKKFN